MPPRKSEIKGEKKKDFTALYPKMNLFGRAKKAPPKSDPVEAISKMNGDLAAMEKVLRLCLYKHESPRCSN